MSECRQEKMSCFLSPLFVRGIVCVCVSENRLLLRLNWPLSILPPFLAASDERSLLLLSSLPPLRKAI